MRRATFASGARVLAPLELRYAPLMAHLAGEYPFPRFAESDEFDPREDVPSTRIVYLRDAITDALLLHGIYRQHWSFDNVLLAESRSRHRFAIRVSNLPPELSDFHTVDGMRRRTAERFVVAPGKHMDWRRKEPLEWLSRSTNILFEDEGQIDALARRLR